MEMSWFSLWAARLTTFSLAALTAASATYWVLQWPAAAPRAPPASVASNPAAPPDPRVIARVLGGGQSEVTSDALEALASRFKLSGVVLEQADGGYAVIAVDDQPAKPFHVGDAVSESLVLHSVERHSAALATSVKAPVSLTLELPDD